MLPWKVLYYSPQLNLKRYWTYHGIYIWSKTKCDLHFGKAYKPISYTDENETFPNILKNVNPWFNKRKKQVFLKSNAWWFRSHSKLKLISRKQHKTYTHLSCKPYIIEKTASSEKFRLKIDLNFLENVNGLIEPPWRRSSIEYLETLLGVLVVGE